MSSVGIPKKLVCYVQFLLFVLFCFVLFCFVLLSFGLFSPVSTLLNLIHGGA